MTTVFVISAVCYALVSILLVAIRAIVMQATLKESFSYIWPMSLGLYIGNVLCEFVVRTVK